MILEGIEKQLRTSMRKKSDQEDPLGTTMGYVSSRLLENKGSKRFRSRGVQVGRVRQRV